MKAIIMRDKALLETEMAAPVPCAGQLLVKTRLCGICGSDLHAVHHFDEMMAMAVQAGALEAHESGKDIVLGHEFCGEVLDHGPATEKRLKVGTRVVCTPTVIGPNGPELFGFSSRFPGGFAEEVLLTEQLVLEVPNGISDQHAALTEPLSVAVHAVNAVERQPGQVAMVVGCGPVGLAVILALKRRGIGPILAVDFSPVRRKLAERLGADVVLDPGQDSPHDQWERFNVPATIAGMGRFVSAGHDMRQPVIFECVGVPGLLQSIIKNGPPFAQIIVVGACQEQDRILPALANLKHLRFNFVFAFTPPEFEQTLADIAEGHYDLDPLISKTVGRAEVAAAFDDLKSPGSLVKILVDPSREYADPAGNRGAMA